MSSQKSVDQNMSVSPPLLVEITPNTPAAEALAANSSIRVSKLHKAARSTRIQASIRVVKSTLRTVGGQPGHAGDRRGDPEFYSPNLSVSGLRKTLAEEGHAADCSGSDSSDRAAQSPASLSCPPVPASHAAIAAACRAGEEADRRRMTSPESRAGSSLLAASGDLTPVLQLSPRRRQSDEGLEAQPAAHQVQLPQPCSPDDSGSATTATVPQTQSIRQDAQLHDASLSPPPAPLEPQPQNDPRKKRIALKQFSIIKPPQLDADPSSIHNTFHFHGPRSVRHWINKRRHHEISDDNIRSYVKGKVIDRQHELFIMSIAIMLGMRTSIGRTNMQMAETSHDERRWLDNVDLMAVEKYVFPPRGSQITPPHQLNHTFKFKDYSPHAFAYLRRMFGVNEYEFLLSVCGNANYIEFQSNAKSGQFFFYSKDGKYMIKTMTSAESKFLRRITPHYFRHCAMNPNTLVTKFLGMYRVKLYHLRRNVKFVVMKSVYDTDKHLHHVYDVKGSSTGRDAKAGEVVKKDNDVRRSLPEGAFILEPDLRDRLRIQVERDCQWLKAMKIMDYSMLIGVHNIVQSAHKRNTSTPNKPKKLLAENATTQLEYYGDEFSHTSLDASCMNLDHYLDDDDDDSYLDGSTRQRKSDDVVHALRSADGESEEYVEKAIEDMYWPFHRYYDLQGRRRLMPIKADLIAQENRCLNGNELTEPDASSKKKYFKLFSSSSAPSSFGESPQYQIPVFERPLSERKDGGFTMDLTNVETPLKINIPGAPHLAEYCEGKIFYMGIIDILQQFNIRKRLEARWRRMGGKGWEAASCVHPTIYADRFLRFFDEYTACQREQNNTGNGK